MRWLDARARALGLRAGTDLCVHLLSNAEDGKRIGARVISELRSVIILATRAAPHLRCYFRIPFLVLALVPLSVRIAVAQDTSDVERARALFEAKQFAEARPLLIAHAQANTGDAGAQYWAGRVLMEEDRSRDAQEWLEKAVKLDSASSHYWLWLGRSYGDQTRKASIFRRRGLALRTRAAFEKAAALDSANLDARAHLVDYHLEAPRIVGGNEEEALRQAEEIRRRDEPRGLLELARVYESTKRPAQADSLLAAYERGPPTTDTKALSEAEWVRGRILERQGDRTRARASYQAALELDPRNIAAAESLRSLR